MSTVPDSRLIANRPWLQTIHSVILGQTDLQRHLQQHQTTSHSMSLSYIFTHCTHWGMLASFTTIQPQQRGWRRFHTYTRVKYDLDRATGHEYESEWCTRESHYRTWIRCDTKCLLFAKNQWCTQSSFFEDKVRHEAESSRPRRGRGCKADNELVQAAISKKCVKSV